MQIKTRYVNWLGRILHIANTGPYTVDKEVFYKIKNKLLKLYGNYIGYEYQHISEHCFRCEGSGVFIKNNWSWDFEDSQSEEECWKCGGSGTYREFWSKLDKYKLGDIFNFHQPVEKLYSKPNELKQNPLLIPIKGYITHNKYSESLIVKCCLILMLLYSFKNFRKYFGYNWYKNYEGGFLVSLNNGIYNTWKCFYKTKRKLKKELHYLWHWRDSFRISAVDKGVDRYDDWDSLPDDIPPF